MAPTQIVEPFDVIEHVGPGLVARSVDLVGGALGLERGEEAFHRRVVPDIAAERERARDAVFGPTL